MNRKYKRLYRTIGIAFLLIAIGFIVNNQLRKLGNSISEEYLKELVSKESKGLYQINFKYIDLNIFSKSVTIGELSLFSTPENREDSINAKNIYEAQVNQVKIKLESIIRIYTDKELVVDGIEISDPKLFMTKINPEKEPLKFGRETGELYEKISEYLDLLQVNYLKVTSGVVSQSPTNFQLNAIDFKIQDFSVSQDQKKKKIFYSEAINLGVSQQSILLPDSIHELSFEGFELSTKDSLLNFTNFKISPRKDIDPLEVFQKQKQNVYDIDIPLMELKGINYLKAYEDNFLIVQQVNIPKPKIKIHSVLGSINENTEQAENSILSSLLALFDLIQINDLKIQEGGVNLTLKGDHQQRFLSDNISIDLFNIKLDSTQRDIQDIIHYFEHASVEINDYDYLLPDNLHNIKFKKLNFSTIDSTLSVQDLKIRPSRSPEDSTLTQFNLNLPLLEIEGIAHRDIYDNNRIDLKNLALRNAEIIITSPFMKNDSAQNDIISPQKLYKILGPNLTKIKLDKFSVLNSNLIIADIFSGKSINIQSSSLQIDSTLNSWHMIADSTIIDGQELLYNFKNGQFKVAAFQFENNLHSLYLTKLNLSNAGLGDRIKVEHLSFKGLQFDSIINQKKLNIDSIKLFKPIFDISYRDFNLQPNQSNVWEFPDEPINIWLSEGVLQYQMDKNRNLKITNFNAELNYHKELILSQILANELIFEDNELKHQIYLSKLNVPKNKDRLLLQDIQIKPNKTNDSLSIDLSIPEVSFINFNKDAFIQAKKFKADSMLIKISQLNYAGPTDLKKYFKQTEKNESEFGFAFLNSRIELESSSIQLFDLDNRTSQINNSDAKIEFQNFNFPQEENQNLLYVDNFTISNEYFSHFSTDKDTIRIRDINYSSINKNGEMQEFSFYGSDSITSLKIKNVQLINTNLIDYFETDQLAIQELSSEKTTFKLIIKKQEKTSLPESIDLPFKKLNIEKVLLEDINIEVYHEERERSYHIREADLAINSLDLDATLNPKKIHQHIQSLIFRGEQYKENFGKHYTILADNYTFRYPESSFEAIDIKLRSKYDRFEYNEHIDFQNDWFNLDLSSLKLEQINIDSLLEDQKFIAKKLALNKGDLTVFRDLNVPHNNNRIVPLPQSFLNNSDFAFRVDSIFVNSNIHVQIVPKESSTIGNLVLNIDSGYVFNMRTHHFRSIEPMLLKAKGKLNEEADFNIKVDFPMPSEKSEFNFLGNIGPMDLQNLNQMLVPLGAVEIRSGYNEGVNINFTGNDEFSLGLMEFRYKDLKIDVLDKDTYQSSGFANNLKTIVANSFVIQSKNPRWFKLQNGDIFFKRDKSRSIFNYWAKSLLSGAVSSIGINKSKVEAKAYYRENMKEIKE